jgi:hypothetical protein
MANFDQTHANNILAGSTGQGSFTATTGPIHVRLMTVNGSATANGTELTTGGGYTSGTGAPTVTFASASAGSIASNSAVTVTNMPACTIVGIELWDSTGSPARKWQGALTSNKTVNSGDTFTIGSASLTLALA